MKSEGGEVRKSRRHVPTKSKSSSQLLIHNEETTPADEFQKKRQQLIE
jgi:hypothetical protein